MSRLEVLLFGTFQAQLDGVSLTTFRSVNTQGLFAYLIFQAERPFSRDLLATLFWPDVPDSTAKKNLRQTLYQLRQLLNDSDDQPHPFLIVTRQTIQWNPASDYTVDVQKFLSDLATGNLSAAVGCYHGELLPGFTCNGLEFEDWLRQERERLHRLVLTVLDDLTEQQLAQSEFAAAQASARRQLALESWRESAHRQLMRALALADDWQASLVQYEVCKDLLAEGLGVPPSPETIDLYEAIRNGTLRSAKITTPIPTNDIDHNIPRQTTPFVGRDADLNKLIELLNAPTLPLITIVGPGGMGKSRLAIEAAFRCLESAKQYENGSTSFPDGIFFVSLAQLSHAVNIPTAVAEALRFRFGEREDQTDQLLNHLRSKSMLLILDNFEHLINGGVHFVQNLLRTAKNLQLFVTSRQRLQLTSETAFNMKGLDYSADPEIMRQSGAAQLFLQSARQIHLEFKIDEKSLAILFRICQLVQGMPLGIVLAASWVDTLSLLEIAAEIQQDIDFLEVELRDLPDRQRSMRATFAYSWELLSETERELFTRLSVFRGGFTRRAAKTVTGILLRSLARLVSKSLLQYDAALDRYQIHELLRQFGAEKLREKYNEESARTAHSHYYLHALAEQETALKGKNQRETLVGITADYENVRTAWLWAAAHKQVGLIFRAAESIYYYHLTQSLYEDGRRVMVQAVERLEHDSKPEAISIRCRLMAYQGMFAFLPGRSQEGKSLIEKSVSLLGHQEDEAALITPLNFLAYIIFCADDYDEAEQICQRALLLSTVYDDKFSQSYARRTLGGIFRARGNYLESKKHYEESLRLCLQIGDRRGEAQSLNKLGICIRMLNDDENAGRYYEQALHIYCEIGDLSGEASVLNSIGVLTWYLGDYEAARDLFERSLLIGKEAGSWQTQSASLHRLGNYHWYRGDLKMAINTYKQVIEMHQQMGDLQSEGYVLDNIGLLYIYEGKTELAVKSSRRVLEIARKIGDPLLEGYGLISLGHGLASQNDFLGATSAYKESLVVWRDLERLRPTTLCHTGLALIALEQGDKIQAQEYIEGVLAYLEFDDLEGSDEPFRVYEACCRVLLANDDPRAPKFLQATYEKLQEWASKIPNPSNRRSFLENVPFHRSIMTAFHKTK